ncbi:MAG: L-lactate permease [Carnobacterium sp.]
MTMPINFFFWIICIIPILLLLILMVLFQWGASKAAPFTLMITCLLGLTIFKADLTVLSSEILKASWSSIGIILVIFTAIFLYEIGTESSAFVVLNHLFTRLAPNELIRILIIGISFASFLQGITGFGVPILIVAPLLLTMGVAPLYAVIIPLLGHSWAGTFGTLALGWEALLVQTSVVDNTLILYTAIYASILLFILTGLFNLVIAFKYGHKKAVKKGFLALTILTFVQGLGQLIVALVIPELAVVVPSILSLVAMIFLSKTRFYGENWRIEDSPIMIRLNGDSSSKIKIDMTAKQALAPYMAMTGLSIIVLLVKPLRRVLSSFQLGLSFSRTETGYGIINPAVERYAPLTLFTHVSFFYF